MERKWYVICTKQQQEKKVIALLNKKGIENYCPFTTVEKKMGANKITVHEPLFRSYVFVLLADSEISMVKNIPYIINTVYWKSTPVVVKPEEINALKIMAESFMNIRIERAAVCINEKIGILKENFSDISNQIGLHHQRIAVTLHSLGYTLIATKENFRYSKLEKPVFSGGFLKRLNLFSILGL